MATEPNEPRALAAALSGTAFQTRVGGLARHASERHVERWAPEASAQRVRPLRTLGFVDRLITPWIETAQRSASMRLFQQYQRSGPGERDPGSVSWVFPRPWYQDELDWMAAARRQGGGARPGATAAPNMLTTRGTYVADTAEASAMRMPAALYEHVAPSLSIAGAATTPIGGLDADAYTPLVPLAAVQAAALVSRAMAPLLERAGIASPSAPALRGVLSSMLARAATGPAPATRLSLQAPELVTPPAPRRDGDAAAPDASVLADGYAAHHALVLEIQRQAAEAARREAALRARADATGAPDGGAAGARENAARQAVALEAATGVREAEARQVAARVREAEARQAAAQALSRREIAAREDAAREDAARQRDASRHGGQLHPQARSAAVDDARAALANTDPDIEAVASSQAAGRDRAAAVTAAVSAMQGLPPELAAYVARRPERPAEAIQDLADALRTAELLARGAAAHATFEATRGPRVVLPAGLGGLVSAVERAHVVSDRDAGWLGATTSGRAWPGTTGTADPDTVPDPLRLRASGPRRGAGQAGVAVRVPTLPMLTGPGGASMPVALAATVTAAPAALGHVAWADRWLARMSGAGPRSLDAFSAATPRAADGQLTALAAAAPGAVFVAPMFEARGGGVPFGATVPGAVAARDAATSAAGATPSTTAGASDPAGVLRFDDDAETPDEVFLQIAAATAGVTPRSTAPTAPSAVVATDTDPRSRATLADLVARQTPAAPGAGMSAQLAASPFAPALRHLLSLPDVGTFDVRALFTSGLSASYLAGMLDDVVDVIRTPAGAAPAWASRWLAVDPDGPARTPPAWEATYVGPDLPRDASGAELGPALDARMGAVVSAAMPASADAMRMRDGSSADTRDDSITDELTTLRTTLLSFDLHAGERGHARVSFEPSDATRIGATRSAAPMIDAMTLPLLEDGWSIAGHRDGAATSWAAPGMLAERAHSWSVATERSASDLALDFVTPELVLAARVYGLGAAEAAQAARLAVGGAGQLTAMASAVDRTFVTALAIEAGRREQRSIRERALGDGTFSAEGTLEGTRASVAMRPGLDDSIVTAYPLGADVGVAAHPELGKVAFGIERRSPRGATLWPAATVAALGLHAPTPDGQMSMSVAALELLAARTVAELGTYAALADLADPVLAGDGTGREGGLAAELVRSDDVRATSGGPTGARADVGAASPEALGERSEREVLEAAGDMVPLSRRARFEALYVALSSSTTGRAWSPAARAARALALSSRGDQTARSPYERAAAAWDVLPVVYGVDAEAAGDVLASSFDEDGAARPAGARARRVAMPMLSPSVERARGAEPVAIDPRPGLAALSARAGEALSSYVEPATQAPSAAASSAERSSSSSAPTAAQELVRTGRPAGRYGGGEVEIPSWFEAAARKMFEDRGALGDGISLAELTLVTAAPSAQIATAAKTEGTPPLAPAVTQSMNEEDKEHVFDVERIANDVYREILVLMDAARARNGEPFV